MAYQSAQVFDPVKELQIAASLLVSKPTLSLPQAIASVIALASVLLLGVVSLVALIGNVFSHRGWEAVFAALPLVLAGGIVVSCIVGYAALLTLCAAPDVLEGREIDWNRAIALSRARLGAFVSLIVIFGGMACVLVPLCALLVGFPLIFIAWYFLSYATAACVIGGESATAAIGTSIRIARTRVPESLISWVAIVVVFVLGNFIAGLFSQIPIVNIVASFFIGGLTAAYGDLVRVRFYLLLRVPGTFASAPALRHPTPQEPAPMQPMPPLSLPPRPKE